MAYRWMLLGGALLVGCGEVDVEDTADVDVPLYSAEAMVIDLGSAGDTTWTAVNDTVMGGVSQASVTYTDETLMFEGAVSTDSNGGFTSVRSEADQTDLREYSRLLIHMRNTGQPFSFVIADKPLFFQSQFKADLDVPDDGWHTLEIPFSEFKEYAFEGGYPTETGETIAPSNLKEVHHFEIISKLFEDGPFEIEVDWIAFD
ncbi:MAG: CIA30 family protein [Myxococcota bacterium]